MMRNLMLTVKALKLSDKGDHGRVDGISPS
uniref:Uncharacterized protein n=1 Tax=Anguilla anguilla TaxID=7936 RepID=A0A0E9SPA6_ANGAN